MKKDNSPKSELDLGSDRSGFNQDGEGNLITLAELQKRHILAVLEHCEGNRTHAAKILDISIRTLRNKLNDYNAKRKSGPEKEAGSNP